MSAFTAVLSQQFLTRPPDPQAMEDLVYNLTIMESTLILLLGTMMSVEGQAAYQAPIRWMPKAAEWAHKARRSIVGLPSPVGYGANRAGPCCQFVCRETLPPYYQVLCQIFKTVFDGCGIIIKNEAGKFEYDNDFVWCATTQYPTVWHFAQAWLLLTCPEEAKNVSKRAIPLFWRNHASKRLLPLWQQFSTIQPPPELAVPFSACIACGVRGALSVEVRDHVRDYLVVAKLLVLGGKRGKVGLNVGKSCCRIKGAARKLSHWVAIHRSFQNRSSNVPHRFATPERLLVFFEEKQDLWREHWAQEFREFHSDAGVSSPTAGVDSELIEDHSAPCSSMQSIYKGKDQKR